MKVGADTTGSSDLWLAVVNPTAGEGLGGREWPHICGLLVKAGIRHETVFTQHKYHAVELTVQAVNSGIRRIIVVGGATTLHEVVNGLFIQRAVPTEEITLGIIPILTSEGHEGIPGIPNQYPEAVNGIASGYFSLHTVAAVLYHNSSYGQERYAVSSVEGGIKAALLKNLLRQREEGRSNPLRKWLGAAKTVLKYRLPRVNIWVDGTQISDRRIAGVCIKLHGIESRNTDVSMELSVSYRSRRILSVLQGRKLCNGCIPAAPSQTIRGRHIKIESCPAFAIAADGEVLGYSPAELRIAANAVKVAVPESSFVKELQPYPLPKASSTPFFQQAPIPGNTILDS